MSLPAVGFILGIVILLEVGDVNRFASAEHLASYAGAVPSLDFSRNLEKGPSFWYNSFVQNNLYQKRKASNANTV